MPKSYLARLIRAGIAIFAAGLVVACSQLKPDPAAEATAQLAYTRLVNGEDDALDSMLIPAARNPHDKEMFAQMRALVPKSTLESSEQLNWRTYVGTGGRQIIFQHVYHYGDRQVLATTVLVPGKVGDAWGVLSLNVQAGLVPQPAPAAQPTPPATSTKL